MRRTVIPSLVAWGAAALLALAVQQAGANQLSLSGRTFRATWSPLQFTPAGAPAVRCPVTVEGSFHSSTLRKVARSLVGYVTRAALTACSGGTATLLTETLPWHVQYDTFSGTLPNITGVTLRVPNIGASGTIIGMRCVYRATEASPARFIATIAGGTVTGFRADERSTIPLSSGGMCPSTAELSGTARFTALGSTASVRVALIAAPPPTPRIVTVGDSFISGEGGRWAGNSVTLPEGAVDALRGEAYLDDPETGLEKIWLCHRSMSWSGGIIVNGSPLAENLACSGARRATFIEPANGDFKPGLDLYDTGAERGQARMLKEYALAHPGSIRMVVVSIGGNDFGFGRIVTNCVTVYFAGNPCKDEVEGRRVVEANNIAATVIAVTDAIREVRRAMFEANYPDNSYRIVVLNYISPLPPAAQQRPYNFNQRAAVCPMRDVDATWAYDTLLPALEGAVWQGAMTTQLTNIVRLDVSRAFDGRRLCETGVGLLEENGYSVWSEVGSVDHLEWVFKVRRAQIGSQYPQESIHPSYWGQLALRRCLRLAYNNGAPIGGRCVINGPGLTAEGEPVMRLN